MGEHDPTEYGTHIAADYDEIYGAAFDTDGAVACLADLAGDGPVADSRSRSRRVGSRCTASTAQRRCSSCSTRRPEETP
jgi:hypothetical protein